MNEEDDLFQNVIPDIHRHYPVFANAQPRCGCLLCGDDNDMNKHLGWKLAQSIIHFDVIVIIRIGLAAVMMTIFGTTTILCLIECQ